MDRGHTEAWMYITPLNYILKNGKLYHIFNNNKNAHFLKNTLNYWIQDK